MKYKSIKASQITMTQLMLPSYSNFSGKIHGGYVLNLMDQIAFACASKHSGYYCVTASVNKVDFLNPIEVGELVTLKASINFTGRTSMVVGLRVESENIQTGVVKHCNSSYFTMVAKDKDGQSVPVPGIILNSAESIRRFARSMERQQHAQSRDQLFNSADFNHQAYLDKLVGQNAKVSLPEAGDRKA
ncbi:MAG: acyl-CoA thioesterase [Bacteroidia bacterium]|nr:acyl-CoA thioesterase [Bacteroidia bacterium]